MFSSFPRTRNGRSKCSNAGIHVAFGSLVTGDFSDGIGDVGSDIIVPLTNSKLNVERCTTLAVVVGNAVLALAGSQSAP